MRRSLAALGLLAVVVTGAGGSAAAGAAVDVVAVGWWTDRPGALPQPEGGFEVARGLDGLDSVSAVRTRVGPGGVTGPVTLILDSAAAAVSQPGGALQLCRTDNGWQPANAGPLADAPAADCAAALPLQQDPVTGVWTTDIGGALAELGDAGGEVSFVVFPQPNRPADLPLELPYQVQFTTASALVPAGAPEPTTTSVPVTAPGDGSAAPPAPVPVPVPGPRPAPPVARPTVTAPLPAPAPAETAVPDVSVVTAPAGAPSGLDVRGGGRRGADQPWGRLLWLIPLCVLAGAASAYARRWALDRGVIRLG